jgi:hypothetical protein
LPKYSPDNPIELPYSKSEALLRKVAAPTVRGLYRAIRSFVPARCSGMYQLLQACSYASMTGNRSIEPSSRLRINYERRRHAAKGRFSAPRTAATIAGDHRDQPDDFIAICQGMVSPATNGSIIARPRQGMGRTSIERPCLNPTHAPKTL